MTDHDFFACEDEACAACAALPSRRLQITEVVTWEGIGWLVSVGFDRRGRAREIFAEAIKSHRALDLWAQDSCILLSHFLQTGIAAQDLLAKLTPLPSLDSVVAPSFIGLLLAKAVEIESDSRAAIREALLCAAGRHPLQLGGDA